MEGKPKRLRPWLESLIDSGDIPGLTWIDPPYNTKFQIPWKHRGKQDWTPDNSRIFMEWAKQTGRYREGVDKEDYPAWKTRLRCAFNKAPDIEEVKEMSRVDAQCPYKVYRLKPQSLNMAQLAGRTHLRGCHGYEHTHFYHHHQQPDINHFTSEQIESGEIFRPICLKSEPQGRMLDTERWCQEQSLGGAAGYPDGATYHLKMELDANESMNGLNDESFTNNAKEKVKVKVDIDGNYNDDTFTFSKLPDATSPRYCDDQLVLQVFYCGKQIIDERISRQQGCKIYYPQSIAEGLRPSFNEMLYGPAAAQPIVLPPCEHLMNSEKQRRLGQELLERGLLRGLMLRCEDNNIHAYRLCQVAVFHSTNLGKASVAAVKLRRAIDPCQPDWTVIFDYHNTYIPALKDYVGGEGPLPDPYCYLVFGQEIAASNLDNSVLIVVKVTTQRALEDHVKAQSAVAQRTPHVEVSKSDDFDRLARDLTTVGLQIEKPETYPVVPDLGRDLQYSPDEPIKISTSKYTYRQPAGDFTAPSHGFKSEQIDDD